MNKLKSKRKKAEVGIDLPQPQMDERAPQPTKLFEGESSSGDAELQEKMEMATKEFNSLLIDRLCRRFDPEFESMPRDQFIFQVLSPSVQYTPRGIFYLFEGQWVRLIEADIFDRNAPEDIRKAFKRYGKVNWTLPRIKKGGTAV